MSDTLGFYAIAEDTPDRLAIADPDYNEISYGELYQRVNQISHGLRAMGLERGDHIATTLPNTIEQVALCLAAFQSGYYITTVNWHLVGPEIAYILGDAESKIYVTHERFAHESQRAADEAGLPPEARFSVGNVPGFRSFDELTAGQSADRPEKLSAGSFMFYTSGTTGRPKGVRRDLPDAHPDDAAKGSGMLFLLFGKKPHDGHVHITQAPLYHTAVNNWTTTSLHWGHSVTLMDRWTPEGALERIQKYKVTQSHMVPTMFHRLLALPEEKRNAYDISSLRCMIHAAAPCPVETKKKMLDWWGPVIWEYGGTHLGQLVAKRRPDFTTRLLGLLGLIPGSNPGPSARGEGSSLRLPPALAAYRVEPGPSGRAAVAVDHQMRSRHARRAGAPAAVAVRLDEQVGALDGLDER